MIKRYKLKESIKNDLIDTFNHILLLIFIILLVILGGLIYG